MEAIVFKRCNGLKCDSIQLIGKDIAQLAIGAAAICFILYVVSKAN